jgi:LPXTG-motif cell wall-anchored protein
VIRPAQLPNTGDSGGAISIAFAGALLIAAGALVRKRRKNNA